jgi:SAM-dependent methyltransferase
MPNTPMPEDWWIDFYDGVHSECTLTHEAAASVAFILKLFEARMGASLLDLCCGKGGMADGFSQSGLRVTGVDCSEYLIAQAQALYGSGTCRFVLADAREYRLPEPADYAVNWHTSFAYGTEDAQNARLLAAVSENLKTGGQFVLATLNPDYILSHFQRFIVRETPYQDSSIIAIRESFLEDRMLKSHWTFVFPDGRRTTRDGQTRLYTVSELVALLSRHHLMVENLYGNLEFEPFDAQSSNLILHGRKVAC